MKVSDSIGSKIKAYRRAAHLSQKELGKRCGMSQQMVTQYENDMRNPKIETLKRFADALNIPVSALQPEDMVGGIEVMKISEKIKLRRAELNMSREALARKSGVSLSAIQKYESGDRKPKLETLQRISDALDVPITYFGNCFVFAEQARDYSALSALTALQYILEYLGIDTSKMPESELDSAARDIFRYIAFRYKELSKAMANVSLIR